MARTICCAGVVKSVSYLIMPTSEGVVASVKSPEREIITKHTEMEIARNWLDKRLDELLRINYETE